MTIMRRLRSTLRAVAEPGGWKGTCPAGPPVPGPDECRGTECDSVRLTTLRPGACGTVSCLVEPWTPDAAKLATLGLLPGVRVRLLQRSPAYVLRVGRTDIALDRELAGRIRLHPDAAA